MTANNSAANNVVFFFCSKFENSSVRQWPGRSGFNPRSSHTKDLKNGT